MAGAFGKGALPMSLQILCDGCGKQFNIADDYSRNKIQCPDCGVMCEIPARPKRSGRGQPRPLAPPSEGGEKPGSLAAPPLPLASALPTQRKSPEEPPPPRHNVDDDEDNGDPYQLTGGATKICPNCHREMPLAGVLCVACGFDHRNRKKSKKSFEPVHRDWQSGWPLKLRARIYITCQVVVVLSLLTGLWIAEEDPVVLIGFALFGTLILVFLLGTFDRTILRRTARGQVNLIRIWRIGFFARPEWQVPLDQYDRVLVAPARGADMVDWLIMLMLLPGIVPALIWLYLVIIRQNYSASVAGTGGYDELVLYRGADRGRAEEIGHAVSEVLGLRYDGT